MKTCSNIEAIKEPMIGDILISQAFWNDTMYNRSVVLVIEHNEFGSTGIILNKLSNIKVKSVFPDINTEENIYYGGPFGSNLVGFIHDYGDLHNAIPITDDLFWCGNVSELKREITNNNIDVKKVKFFAGFVEWGPGELYEEIKEKQWWTDVIDDNDLFNVKFKALWAYKLIKAGNNYGVIYTIADPSLS